MIILFSIIYELGEAGISKKSIGEPVPRLIFYVLSAYEVKIKFVLFEITF